MAYIFIVKYSVLFGLFNFGLGLSLLNLASASTLTSTSRLWPRPRPQVFGLGLDLGLKCLASFNISDWYTYSALQRRVVLKWFYLPQAVGATLSKVHALHRVPF